MDLNVKKKEENFEFGVILELGRPSSIRLKSLEAIFKKDKQMFDYTNISKSCIKNITKNRATRWYHDSLDNSTH